MCALVNSKTLDKTQAAASTKHLADEVGAHNLCAIESANEFNNPGTRPNNWAAQLRDYHEWLYRTVRANAKLDGVPVVAPSIWGRIREDYVALGNLEPFVDKGNFHYYTGGPRPTRARIHGGGEYDLNDAITEARIIAPHRGLFATEFGYNTGIAGVPMKPWIVTETAAAKYILRGLLDLFAAGVEKSFIYSLIDDAHRDKHHGLLNIALQPRKTFFALKNFLALFRDGEVPFSTKPLQYRLSGGDGSLRTQLFQKSDGSFLLTLYRDVESYDRSAMRDIQPAPVQVQLTFDQPASRIFIFTPTFDAMPVQRHERSRSISVPVYDHVSVVKIVQELNSA